MGDEAPPPYAPFVPGQCSPERIRYINWLQKQVTKSMARIPDAPSKKTESRRGFSWGNAILAGALTAVGISIFE
jgi:hypothetical protein